MAPTPNDERFLEDLYTAVAQIFEEAQNSIANHKKNCVALFKVHTKAATITRTSTVKRFAGEKAFQEVFMDMLGRVLIVKKGPANADRIVKYTGSFVTFLNEKANEARKAKKAQNPEQEEDEDEEVEETPTSRFVARLLSWLMQGLGAKNKNVRYRCVQIISEIISYLGYIDEDTYDDLREALLDRLNDKEPSIRSYSVVALSKLIGSEGLNEKGPTILDTVLDVTATDPGPEVRRAALLHVPISSATLDAILSRTRDVDAVTRKLVYTGVLKEKLGHPRHLSIAQREQVVKDGLGDREPAVRQAAGKLVLSWFDTLLVEADAANVGNWVGDDGGVMKGLVHFLSLFDVVGPGIDAAVDAVLSIFTIKPNTVDSFDFPEPFWRNLTPESIVLARVFVEHCVKTKCEEKLESASLPVVTAFAFHIQGAYNSLLEILQEIETAKILRAGMEEEEADEELEEELARREVIMNELLRITLNLDYGDEIGRRKVFSVVKDMLAHPELPPGLINGCLDVLKAIMPSERDLIRVIVEIVVELREGEEDAQDVDDALLEDDQSDADVSQATTKKDRLARRRNRDELPPAERAQADLTDIRCLMLCIAMLERVNGTFEDNSTLEGILGDLIIPSVKRKELVMREKALVSLGLCCLIAKNMALSSFQLFLSQAQNAPGELKVQVLRVIMDLLIMYDQEVFGKNADTATKILDFLLQIMQSEESPEAQAIIATGLCKLLLAGMIDQTKVITALALMYVSPNTTDNQQLRQCLSYFFPVYSYSLPANQLRVQSVFMSTFDLAARMHEELDEDQEMISPYQFGLLMVDWTNPQKAAEVATVDKTENPHALLAIDILIALYDSDRSADEQKSLCQLLAQLHFEPGLDKKLIHKLNILLEHHEEQCPFDNAPIDKLFNKFKNTFAKLYTDEIKEIDPREYINDEFTDLYQRIGVDAPGDGQSKGSRARGKRKAIKGYVDVEDDEDEEEEEEDEEDEEQEEDEQAEDEEEAQDEEMAEAGGAKAESESVADEEAEKSGHEDVAGSDTQAAEEISRASTVTPPPSRSRKPAARKPAAPKTSKASGSRSSRQVDRNESVAPELSERSDEENVPPDVQATPKKKKGTKRASDSAPNSPAVRKRTRVKAPLKPKEETPSSDDEGNVSPTPKKPARQTRARKASAETKPKAPAARRGKKATKAPSPPVESSDEEVTNATASVASGGSPEPAASAASSDDFGGYSD